MSSDLEQSQTVVTDKFARNSSNGLLKSFKCDNLESLLEKKNAFYLVDLDKVKEKYDNWVKELPMVIPYYAVKCNPDHLIIKTLGELGCGFDCASKNEIERVLTINKNINKEKIIYANPIKAKSYIEYAKQEGITLMTVDSVDEIIKIKDVYPEAKILIRILTDDRGSLCRFSNKFGATLEQAEEIIGLCINLGLDILGVSFHVGSGCSNPKLFDHAIKNARILFDRANEYGIKMNILDIGGGFPGFDNEKISFNQIAKVISKSLNEYFPQSIDVKIIAEPGRYFVTESHTLFVNIIGRKITSSNDKILYYVDDGTYQSFNCIMYDHVNPRCEIIKKTCPHENKYKSTIFGQTCDSIDQIMDNVSLPKLEIGDWLLFHNMGAYTVASGSKFNGFDNPSIYYLSSK